MAGNSTRSQPQAVQQHAAPPFCPPSVVYLMAGATSGAVSALATAPLDLIKTRLQVQGNKQIYQGVRDTVNQTLAKEGYRGLYKGLATTLLGLIPNWTVYFTAYGYLKEHIALRLHKDPQASSVVHVSAAMAAGLITACSTNPIWVVKVRLQTQFGMVEESRHYKGIIDCFRRMWKEEGIKSFYRGLVPSLFGVTHVMIQFPLYEFMKNWSRTERHPGREATVTEMVAYSSISKMVASSATYPHEVLRSRLQHSTRSLQKRNTISHSIKKMYHEEGIRGFYRGLGANLLKVTPTAAITFVTYDVVFQRLSAFSKRVSEERLTPSPAAVVPRLK